METVASRGASGDTSVNRPVPMVEMVAGPEDARVTPAAGGRGPEQEARESIDAALEEAGWILQDREAMNLSAGLGVAVREFKMADGHGVADYMLFFVEGEAGSRYARLCR